MNYYFLRRAKLFERALQIGTDCISGKIMKTKERNVAFSI